MELKNISTEDLINELKNRKEAEIYECGLYRKHEAEIKRKYTNNRGFVELPPYYTLLVVKEI